MIDSNLLNNTAHQIKEVEQFNDDLFSILDEGNIDFVMLKRLTDTILKDLKCTEVSLWTINRNNKKVDGTPRTGKDRYLSTSLVCRSKDEECKYDFCKKQEFTHSLKQKSLFADVVDNVSSKKPFQHFSGKEAIERGFTSKDFIESACINHIYVIPITENNRSNSSNEAIAIIELSYQEQTKPENIDMRKYAKGIHSVCGSALRNYTDLQKQMLINRLIEVNEKFNWSDSKSLYKSIIDIITELLPCQGASFFLKDSFWNCYCLKASTGLCDKNSKVIENYDNVRYQEGEGLTGNVGKNGSIFISDNLAKDKERPHLSKTYEIVVGDDNENCDIYSSERVKTGMFIPISSTQKKNNVIGIIRLINKKNRCNTGFVDFFNDVDEDIMAFMSRYLSAIIESYRKEMELRSFELRVSHEVLKPTHNILNYADWMRDHLKEEDLNGVEVWKDLDKINHQAKRQEYNLQVIKTLYGRGRYSIDGSDLYNLVKKSWEEVEPIANRYNISNDALEINVIPNKYIMNVDSNAFVMVFSNLFENAIKYHDGSTETIISVAVSYHKDGKSHIQISDNGIGVKEEDKDSIFNERYRGSNVPNNDGSGLGLATVKKIVEDFNGKIEIIKLMKPTMFEIILPKGVVYYNL